MCSFFILDFYPPNNVFLLIDLLSFDLYFVDLYMYPIINNNTFFFKYMLSFSNIYYSFIYLDFETLKFMSIQNN